YLPGRGAVAISGYTVAPALEGVAVIVADGGFVLYQGKVFLHLSGDYPWIMSLYLNMAGVENKVGLRGCHNSSLLGCRLSGSAMGVPFRVVAMIWSDLSMQSKDHCHDVFIYSVQVRCPVIASASGLSPCRRASRAPKTTCRAFYGGRRFVDG